MNKLKIIFIIHVVLIILCGCTTTNKITSNERSAIIEDIINENNKRNPNKEIVFDYRMGRFGITKNTAYVIVHYRYAKHYQSIHSSVGLPSLLFEQTWKKNNNQWQIIRTKILRNKELKAPMRAMLIS